jgi:hypothetical protein
VSAHGPRRVTLMWEGPAPSPHRIYRDEGTHPTADPAAEAQARAAESTRRLSELQAEARRYGEEFVDSAIARGVLPASERASVVGMYVNDPRKARMYVEELDAKQRDREHAHDFERIYGERRVF